MHSEMLFTMFLIFTGAAVLSTAALYTRQSLLVAYLLLGVLFGPWGLSFTTDTHIIKQISEVGIVFLLFLLGLHLQPQNLLQMLSKVVVVALVSSLVFAGMGFAVAKILGLPNTECFVVGAAMMFSSTIIGLKLLPTTVMHHQHTGEVMISVLLMQDIIAILVLLALETSSSGNLSWFEITKISLGFPFLILFGFLMERYVLVRLLARFDQTQEYIFILSIGWCLGMAKLSATLGISEDIGAFIAGVSLAAHPISQFIAEHLKTLRDFFLVMFFFAIGASFDFQFLPVVFWPALLLAALCLTVKPLLFYYLLKYEGESRQVSSEVGVRLGQASEFSLLVGSIAVANQLIGDVANYLIQATTIITFIISSYWVVLRYPTPIGLTEQMRRN